jgi:hypothetical protein
MNILNCTVDQDREKARAETANLQAVVELCRAKKAANKTGEAAPLIKCLSNKLTGPTASAAAVAVKARLDSAKATFAAAEAKAHAKLTAAALQPAARSVQQPAAPMPPGLDGKARRAFAKAQATMTASNAKTFSAEYLRVAAVHRNSPPAEAAIAKAELEKRGFVVHANGTVTKSSRKA